jgi:hypothetical protein
MDIWGITLIIPAIIKNEKKMKLTFYILCQFHFNIYVEAINCYLWVKFQN